MMKGPARAGSCLAVLGILISCGCLLRLEDKNAPSVKGDLETEYELVSWGREKQGFTDTPPEIKAKGTEISGVGLRLRARLANIFTWTNPEGSLEVVGTLNELPFEDAELVKAKGWGYRGSLLLMPGISLVGDRMFLAGLVGLEGAFLGLDVVSKEDPGNRAWVKMGRMGIPLGFHFEFTIARTVTPSITYAYIPTVSNYALAGSGHDQTFEVALRLWPGSLIPALGGFLWVEGGWLWTRNHGIHAGLFEYEIDIDGPFGGVGLRF